MTDPADLRPPRLPLQPGEVYVTILDERVAWPAVVVESRYLNVGLRADVAAAFCDWHERWLADQATGHDAYRGDDPRDVESDHVYYVPAGAAGHGWDCDPHCPSHAGVYRLVWDQDDERDGVAYQLVVEPLESLQATSDDVPRVWIGADHWLWQLADQPERVAPVDQRLHARYGDPS